MSTFAELRRVMRALMPSAVLSKQAEKRGDVLGEEVRALEGGEMAAARHLGPAPDVEERLGEAARRMEYLARERGVRRRHVDLRVRQRPGPWRIA